MRKLIVGNWKMNGLAASLAELDRVLAALPDGVDAAICPPFTLVAAFAARAAGHALAIGAQDCHAAAGGAHTGDISAAMLADAGARLVIAGHSERRADHAESDALVRAKAEAAIAAALAPIVCVGETGAERDAGRAEAVVAAQLAGSRPRAVDFTIAYEPVWAIGTGRTPTGDEIARMHAAIRERLDPATRILYGGSVNPGNARDIMAIANVGGALVGGASLRANDFLSIVEAARAA